MKSLLVIALALVSVTSFAADHKMESKMDAKADGHKAAMEACKEHSKDKKAFEACIAEHTKMAPATEAPAAAPAKK
jgi:hypothetical protein